MAETQLKQGRAATPAVGARPATASWLLGGLEWGLLLAALGIWAGSRAYTPAMSLGSGLLVSSWVVRWARTGCITRATPLDLTLGLFALSVLTGLWAAPQLGVALPRLYLFLGALGLYYALANSAGRELRLASLGLVMVAAGLSVYFVTQHPWAEASVKFGVVRQVGVGLAGLVPDLGQYKPHPNVVAGLLATAAPVALALLVESTVEWRATRAAGAAAMGALAGLGLFVILAGVVMTESRAVWVALAAAVGLAGWWLAARRLAQLPTRSRDHSAWALAVFWVGLAVGATATVLALNAQPQLLTRALGSLPGPTNTAMNRLELFVQVWHLAQDTPLTGGGLGAFPALYSTYILDIPVLLLTHAHNAYLNLLVEQGWAGLAAFGLTLMAAGWTATRALARPAASEGAGSRALLAAGAAGLVIVAVQGLGDGTLVASRAIPFLFVPAGLVAATGLLPPRAALPTPDKRRRQLALGLGAVGLLAAGLGMLMNRRPLEATWWANLGAVQYARIELGRWPTGEWASSSLASGLAAAEPHFAAALALDPDNHTALYRLALRARLAQDFATASAYLERAARLEPEHRGIAKALGYTYVWLGRLDTAETQLAHIPEARDEMQVYAWWWGQQGRPDLADYAWQMQQQLGR